MTPKILLLSLLILAATRLPAASLNITTSYPTNITTTSAWLVATCVSTGYSEPDLTFYYGPTNFGTNAGWAYTGSVGAVSAGVYSAQATGLTPWTTYYFQACATNASNEIAWAEAWAFRTAIAPSNYPGAYYTAVMVDSNGVIIYPTNLIPANGIVIDTMVAATIKPGDSYIGVATNGSTNTITFPGSTGFPTRVEFDAATNNAHAQETNLQAQITGYLPIYQYYARTNAGETVEVRSASTNITCARTNAVFYPSIPTGHHINSMVIRITGDLTDSGKIYIALGTNSWTPAGNAFRESDKTYVTIVPRPDPTDATRTVISGLGTTASETYQLHLVY